MGDADSFARAVTTQAVAQAFVALNVSETYTSVLESLSDVTANYLEAIGRMAHDAAERAGRSPGDITVLDVLAALGQMPQNGGGMAWKDLREFAFGTGDATDDAPSTGWGQPFHHAVPPFPLSRDHAGDAANAAVAAAPPFDPSHPARQRAPQQNGTSSSAPPTAAVALAAPGAPAAAAPRPYIPAFLPPLPPPHTYATTLRHARAAAGGSGGADRRQERQRSKRQTEDALRKLSGSAAPPAAQRKRRFGALLEDGGGSAEQDDVAAVAERDYAAKAALTGLAGAGSRVGMAPPRRRATDGLQKADLILEGLYDDADGD